MLPIKGWHQSRQKRKETREKEEVRKLYETYKILTLFFLERIYLGYFKKKVRNGLELGMLHQEELN